MLPNVRPRPYGAVVSVDSLFPPPRFTATLTGYARDDGLPLASSGLQPSNFRRCSGAHE
jgi:hypothetical protein